VENILTLFVFYVSIVFGFQYAHGIAGFVGNFFGLDNPPKQLVIASVILTIIFFSVAQWIRKLFIPRSSSESGCLINLVTVGVTIWLMGILSIKAAFYLSGTPVDAVGIPTASIPTLIWHENLIDRMIQFWFNSTEPYFLYQIILGGGAL
jgi:hypothetical protein